MTTARCRGVGVDAINGQLVEIEAHLGNGLPGVTIVGLPDAAVNESRERLRAALLSSGVKWPDRRLTIALLPAAQRKRGSALDVGIAAAVLVVIGAIAQESLQGLVVIGELGLDGRVRPVEATLLRVMTAQELGFGAVVARESLAEAAAAVEMAVGPQIPARGSGGIEGGRDAGGQAGRVLGVTSLRHLIACCSGRDTFLSPPPSPAALPQDLAHPDLSDVAGQGTARAALEVAAAGGHNLLMVGPPGVGKTMLAERLVGLLPEMNPVERREVAAIASVVAPGPIEPHKLSRPFVAPHHTTSAAALTGGGSTGRIRPGLVTAGHRGVLFLDEAPEFDRRALQSLRQPVEHGWIDVSRAGGSARLPARIQLVLAANPCPCGRWTARGAGCECPVAARLRYRAKLRGPLMDRIDLSCWLQRPTLAELGEQSQPESSAAVATRVRAARERMSRRWEPLGWTVNSDTPGSYLVREWPRSAAAGLRELHRRVAGGQLSMRGLHRSLRLAWTFADLGGCGQPTDDDVMAACEMRVPGDWG